MLLSFISKISSRKSMYLIRLRRVMCQALLPKQGGAACCDLNVLLPYNNTDHNKQLIDRGCYEKRINN